MSQHIVILGNGIAGITTARCVRKQDAEARLTVISAESDHFYSRTALMYIYMGHMTYGDTKPFEDFFWPKNRIELVRDYVTQIDTEAQRLALQSGNTIPYDKLVLATGSQSNKFGWPGQELTGVQGLYGLPDLERMEQHTHGIERAVVVGGGLIGIEMAEMLHSRHLPVTFLVREPTYMNRVLPPEESAMVNDEIRANHIDLRLSTELKEILPDDAGRVRAVVTTDGETIPCQFVGLTVGVHPNLNAVQGTPIETNRGILVNEFFETNVPGIYAVGDCAEHRNPLPGRRPVEQLWYTGRLQGQTVANTLCGTRTAYDPGPFFNSAKFVDIEYQTYGDIAPELPEGQETLFWQDADGKHSLRINYEAESGVVVGFNLMGIRYRHPVCERWLRERRTLRDVLTHLGAANFDPEFFTQYEPALVAAYNRRHPEAPITLKRKRGLFPGIFGYRPHAKHDALAG